jgi:DHA1 family multidrug resistance protein-like MFS transporter
MLWLSAPIWLVMLCFLPETFAPNILLKRAQRLRNLTGKAQLKSQSEIDQSNMSGKEVAFDALIKPWQINALDPAVVRPISISQYLMKTL